MSVRCICCQSTDSELVADNGAEYPETRVEFHECQQCGDVRRLVLWSDEISTSVANRGVADDE